jgi:hypothetical protein
MRTRGRSAHVAGIIGLITTIILSFDPSSAFAQTKQDGVLQELRLQAHQRAARAHCRRLANKQDLRGSARKAFMRKCVDSLLAGNLPTPPSEVSYFGPTPVLTPWITPFAGVNVGVANQGTYFSVDPSFTTSGNGPVYGGFAGVLFPIPNTPAQFGFRAGWEGLNISGKVEAPLASPLSDYTARSTWMFYEEGLAKVPLAKFDIRGAYLTGSVGLAQMQTSVTGTSGAFSATDNGYRTGVTFTAGVGTLLGTLPNGTGIEGFAQWRGTQWGSTVSIPGSVPISSFTNEVDVGINFVFGYTSELGPLAPR